MKRSSFPTPSRLAAFAALAIAAQLWACSDGGTAASAGEKKTDTGQGGADAGGIADTDESAVASSCKGISAESRKQFAQYDDQCAFLAGCPTSGKCHCGDNCGADKTQCDAQICAGVDATCLCGEQCDPKGDEVLCPEHVCAKAGDIKGCQKLPSCRYVDKEYDNICKCTQMPNNEPDCWCGGDKCPDHYPGCPSQLCKGKNPDKCVVVPGKKFTGCYCATCGLHGDKPACFFVVCPGTGEGG